MAITIRDTDQRNAIQAKELTRTSTMSKANLVQGGYDALKYQELYTRKNECSMRS